MPDEQTEVQPEPQPEPQPEQTEDEKMTAAGFRKEHGVWRNK